jgi:uncharacterized membrane protein YgcG
MWIVAIAWIYVVALMAATEPTLVGGIMSFLAYCVLPLSILFYLTGSKRRRARRAASSGRSDGADAGVVGLPATGDAGCGADGGGGCDGGGGGGD